jgi:hypothetical protein
VSLSWRERVDITLAPQRITVARYGRGMKAMARDRSKIECTAACDGPAWRPPLDALREWLGRLKSGAKDARVVLSSHFVRHLLVPWNATVAGEREELALAGARFVQVYGEVARSWTVRVSSGAPGTPLLAAAVDTAFLDAVVALLGKSPLRLRSVQPALMAACNLQFANVAPNAWVAIAEPGQLLLGLQRDGQWKSLRSRPIDGGQVLLAEVIEQERLLLGVDGAGEKVYLHQWGDPAIDARGLVVERWSGRDTGEASRP